MNCLTKEEIVLFRSIRTTAALLLAVCLLCGAAAAAGESIHTEVSNPDFEMEVSVGYDGMMTYGRMMPVTVLIRNAGGDFEGTLGVNAYVNETQYDRYELPVSIPASSQREYTLAVRVLTRQQVFTAELVCGGEKVCAVNGNPETVFNPSAMMVGVLSTRPQNLNYLNIDRDNDTLARYEFWQVVPLTAENFPEDETLLRSFGLIVLDDLDPAALSQKQRDALENWLLGGRILLCGGGTTAAANLPLFGSLTGLTIRGMGTSGSVIASLEKGINRTESGRTAEAVIAEYDGGKPLISDAEGQGLVWRTEAGAGRIYTAAFETGDALLNSDPLMHYFWEQLLVDRDQALYSSAMYMDNDSYPSAVVNVSYMAPIEADSKLLPGIFIIIGGLVLACLLWWILKKRDKRQLMWIVLPAIAVIATAGLVLLASASQTNEPMAVIAQNLVQTASGTTRDYSGVSAATPSYGRHMFSLPGDSLRVQVYDYVDWDEEEEEKQTEPDVLRTCNIAGGDNAVTADIDTPWGQVNLCSESEAQMTGRIEGTLWMEADGLHGEIVNGTNLHFAAGQIITNQGYVTVPALAPGEKAEVLMTRKTFSDPQNPYYEDGGLYEGTTGLYTIINNAMGYTDERGYPDSLHNVYGSMINGAVDELRRAYGNFSYGAYDTAVFMYCAAPTDLPRPELSVDGARVERMARMALLTAELEYLPVGRTGVVYRSPGMDIPVRVETDENGLPTDTPLDSGKDIYYHTLNETPTFLFDLKEMGGVKVDSLLISMNVWYLNECRVYAYSHVKNDWVEIEANKDIEGPGDYLDAKGRLFVQFRSVSQDMYSEVPAPMISLQGRVENAEN